MNKRGIVKFLFVFAAVLISFYSIIKNYGSIGLGFQIPIAMTIYMYFIKDKIKRNKFIYDVILMLLMVFSTLFVGYFIFTIIGCMFQPSCGNEWNSVFLGIYPVLLFLILLTSINDIKQKTNKVNDIFTIVASGLILLVHANYYFEPYFIHRLMGDSFLQDSFDYVAQYYVYFVILYFVVLVHHRVNQGTR